ncbi:beta-1,3-galactosyltransferase 5-like [Argonauta hians]
MGKYTLKLAAALTLMFCLVTFAYYYGYTSIKPHGGNMRLYLENSLLKAVKSAMNISAVINNPSMTTAPTMNPKPVSIAAAAIKKILKKIKDEKNGLKATSIIKTVDSIKTVAPQPSRKACNVCVPNDIPFVLQNQEICKTPGSSKLKSLDLFIIVFTQLKSVERRNVIRNTWLQHTKNNTANVRYVFAFGQQPTALENKALLEEYKLYKDIVQGDFKDCYRNLTYKTISMLGWVAKNCPNVKHVMKTDDDMWVNVPKIINEFTKKPLHHTVAGVCMLQASPIRNTDSKWYVSTEEYPRTSYPGFCSGTGYVMDLNTAISVNKVAVDVPFLYLEDVYVALCIEHLGGDFHLQPISDFHNGKYNPSDVCNYHSIAFTSHYMTVKDIQRIWDAKC